jgi:integrase
MVALLKRPGRRGYYLRWWQDGKEYWRATGIEDEGLARQVAAETAAARRGQASAERVAALLAAAGAPQTAPSAAAVSRLLALAERTPGGRVVTERQAAQRAARVQAWQEWMAHTHPAVRQLSQVTPALAAEYLAHLERRGLAGQTRNNHLSALAATWQRALVPAGLTSNPWRLLARASGGGQRKEAFTLAQLRALYRAAQAYPSAHAPPGFWPAATALGYTCGLRLGDVCHLRWESVDLAAGTLTVVAAKTRLSRRRELRFRLASEARAHLPPIPRTPYATSSMSMSMSVSGVAGPVWPAVADAHRRAANWLPAEWRQIVRAAGITPPPTPPGRRAVAIYGFHALRHSFVTLALDAGVDPDAVRLAAGHGSLRMTEHYSHARGAGERVAAALPRLDE